MAPRQTAPDARRHGTYYGINSLGFILKMPMRGEIFCPHAGVAGTEDCIVLCFILIFRMFHLLVMADEESDSRSQQEVYLSILSIPVLI